MVDQLSAGEIGFITASIKQVADCHVGDTVTEMQSPCTEPLPGFNPSQSVVFCGLFPTDSGEFELLKDSLNKLHLNDTSFSFETETSGALGFGFRCGFLGLLHLEIIQERLMREFNVDIITTAPSVIYEIYKHKNEMIEVHNPADMPDPTYIDHIKEPWIEATVFAPDDYLGSIIELCVEKRGKQIDLSYSGHRAILVFELPLQEVVFDFYDKLKSLSSGYASCDWHLKDYRASEVIKLSILVNGEAVDALSCIAHKTLAERKGREICKKLQTLIPRQQYKIALQAAIGGKIVARETIQPYRKDVTGNLYGGDVTRKKKLLEKTKEG